MVLLAQISDLHLDGTERARERAARVMDYLRALPTPVDALLVTGDIADHGEPSEYQEAARILAAPFPVLTCPGNHDARSPMRTALLGEPAGDGPINRMHLIGGTAILMCDSSIPGEDEGLLDAETLAWLSDTLDSLPAGTRRWSPSTTRRCGSTTRCRTPSCCSARRSSPRCWPPTRRWRPSSPATPTPPPPAPSPAARC